MEHFGYREAFSGIVFLRDKFIDQLGQHLRMRMVPCLLHGLQFFLDSDILFFGL